MFTSSAVSTGARNGTVEKFSEKGLFLKTFEGELATNNFSNSGTADGTNNNTFEFSVPNDEIAKLVEDARKAGVRVGLEYEQRLFTMNWPFCTERRTVYEVTGVTVLPNQDVNIPKTPGM